LQRYRFTDDSATQTLTLIPAEGKDTPLTLHYTQEAEGQLVMDCTVGGDVVRARLRATNVTHFTLRQPLR
jgi:hypothetical protein